MDAVELANPLSLLSSLNEPDAVVGVSLKSFIGLDFIEELKLRVS